MIQIVTTHNLNWVKGYKKKFEENGFEVQVVKAPKFDKNVSLYLLMWLDFGTLRFLHSYDVKNISFIRRFEVFTGELDNLDFSKIGRLVVLNDYFRVLVKKMYDVDSTIVPNGVILDDWTYKDRGHGTEIAWVGFVNHRKNLPLAMEIMSILPNEYTLHIAGEVQNADAYHYVNYIAYRSGKKVVWYDHVDDMDAWLEDKNYLLSTSVSEGCPNNVIEAMAKGIKPIVHSWPGADFLFGDYTFYFPFDAVNQIVDSDEYNSKAYRELVETRFAKAPYEEILKLGKELIDA